jgi:hypothetical protein
MQREVAVHPSGHVKQTDRNSTTQGDVGGGRLDSGRATVNRVEIRESPQIRTPQWIRLGRLIPSYGDHLEIC